MSLSLQSRYKRFEIILFGEIFIFSNLQKMDIITAFQFQNLKTDQTEICFLLTLFNTLWKKNSGI